MYPQKFNYVRATSVKEACDLLRENSDAKLLAGGHSLLPLLKLRQASAGTLVDIGRLSELKGLSRTNGSVTIGSLTTHSMLAAFDPLPDALREAAANVGDLQVRNRGTIGGNLSHADPASDHPTVLTALGATYQVAGPSGQRSIPAADFCTGLFETVFKEHEVLTSIDVPVHGRGSGSAYAKMVNPASGYAMLGAAAMITLDGEKCSAASVALGGLTQKPMKAASVEANLIGKKLDKATIAAAAKSVLDDLDDDLLGDIHASAEYRRAMTPVYLERALNSAMQRAMA
jgi:aerobic carbon-monoxide dehydrogenase medium subunit